MEQAEKETEGFEIIRTDNDIPGKIASLGSGIRRMGVEEDDLSFHDGRKYQESLSWCDLADSSAILRQMRQVKDDSELSVIREVIRMTDLAFSKILDSVRQGKTEEEISLELEYSLRGMGASGRSFDYIVASGHRSALPHGVATEKKLAENEFVTLDFGAKYKGYCSDFTRTVFIGLPDSRHMEIYQVVLDAQKAGIKALKPGLSGKEVDAAARDIINEAGYGEYFGHGLGHSLGLEIHENPRLSPLENGIIRPGMIVTVEPGIYIPGWGGVRIEDVVLVTCDGAEVLTQASKEFIIIQ